jgi:hypothetical protein
VNWIARSQNIPINFINIYIIHRKNQQALHIKGFGPLNIFIFSVSDLISNILQMIFKAKTKPLNCLRI